MAGYLTSRELAGTDVWQAYFAPELFCIVDHYGNQVLQGVESELILSLGIWNSGSAPVVP